MKKTIFALLILIILSSPLTTFAFNPNYQFTDQEKDTESGLYNFDAREYNPNIGRFNQLDPVSNNLANPQLLKQQTGQDLQELLKDPQNLNPYGYARNNPVRYVDPNGQFAVPVYDVTSDVFFFNQSLNDYQQNKSWLNTASLALDTIGLMLPLLPAGTGGLFKGFIKGLNSLSDLWNDSRLFKRQVKDVISLVKNADYPENVKDLVIENINYFKNDKILITKHAAEEIYNRVGRGITKENVLDAVKNGELYFDSINNNYSFFRNGIRVPYDPVNKTIITVVEQASMNPERFIMVNR